MGSVIELGLKGLLNTYELYKPQTNKSPWSFNANELSPASTVVMNRPCNSLII